MSRNAPSRKRSYAVAVEILKKLGSPEPEFSKFTLEVEFDFTKNKITMFPGLTHKLDR
jgi:hypothetical protein